MPRTGWLVGLAGLLALALGVGVRLWTETPSAGGANPQALLQASLPDLEGRERALAEWRGKVLLVNFWATWCEPCREEIPDLVALQSEFGPRGFQVVGIAIDQAQNARDFASKIGMNYPSLVGGYAGIELAKAAGNSAGGLPFSVLIDRQGKVAATALGVIKMDRTRNNISELLGKWD